MALECTHIRFAVDMKDLMAVKNMDKYISGTIYPDSRYLTGLDRIKTHNPDFIDKDFYGDDDFKKGWILHLICDKSQLALIRESFSDLVYGQIEHASEVWINLSVIKTIQALNDFVSFDIQPYLNCLEYAEIPNGEEQNDMDRYNRIFVDEYKGRVELHIETELKTWVALGMKDDLIERMRDRIKILMRDKEVMKKIMGLYDMTIVRAKKDFAFIFFDS